MGNIVLLDDLTINKIAAGEVIERPASVVKEMVENSIDAGATNINIEIKNGGISYIRITDNGKGIEKDDMEIAFERHATSKIRTADDLEQVKSMGFRGEALASIAAISHVEMKSRTREQETGNRIVVEGGRTVQFEETSCSIGTTIEVTDLFYNTPVRYKFLKKDYTESGYIEDAITRLAIVNPFIAFKLVNSGKTIIQTSGNGKLQDVIYAIYGKDIAQSILDVNYTYEDMIVTGVVGKPEIARSNRTNQLFFVNKRYVKDKTLSGATENSFKGLLPIGKYGFVVLNIDINPKKVDVNVHPAKLEVRFEEENKVFKAVYHAIKDTLLKAELIADASKENKAENINTVNTTKIETKPSITELFRKMSSHNTEPQQENNIIGEIYNQKDKESNYQSKEKIELNKNNMFKELMQMQQRLKEEVENDPTLKTNIDSIINKTSELKLENEKNIEEDEEEQLDESNNNHELIQKENNEKEEPIIINEEETNSDEEESIQEEFSKILNKSTTLENLQIEEDEKNNENNDIYNFKINENEDKNEKEEQTLQVTQEQIGEMINELEKSPEGEINPDFIEMYQKTFGKLPASIQEKQKQEEEKINAYELIQDNNVSVFEDIEEYKAVPYKFIGIVFKTYIIIEIEKEMYIIDQHAAHERLLYEKVKKNYYSVQNKEAQMLLLPDVITLTHKEMEIARDNMEMFRKAGFELEEFGENTIKLSGVPDMCVDLDTKELFLETLDEINTVARTAKQEIEERFIATVACKAAVKANMALTKEEVDSLMSSLLELPNPFTCPHGRPTAIKMNKNDIERKFARRK